LKAELAPKGRKNHCRELRLSRGIQRTRGVRLHSKGGISGKQLAKRGGMDCAESKSGTTYARRTKGLGDEKGDQKRAIRDIEGRNQRRSEEKRRVRKGGEVEGKCPLLCLRGNGSSGFGGNLPQK